jgi:hypothetical protein
LNGFPPLAAAVLEDSDELLIGREVAYFGAYSTPVNERFTDGADEAFCARCKRRLAPGDEVMRCAACHAPYHEGALAEKPGEIRPCFSYFGEPCTSCGRSAEELVWSPEEVWL